MFAKFSPASGRVLRAAEQECRNHNHYYIGVEHLLLALVQESYDSIAVQLMQDGIDPTEVHTEVRRALGTGDDRSWEGILVTPRVRTIVGIAEVRSGDAPIDPEHLLAAITEEGNSRAAEILRRVKERNKVSAAE